MHDRLTEIIGEEVVGEVTQIGDSFFDIGLGRIGLKTLSREAIEPILDRLKHAFPQPLDISDWLYPQDASQIIRGMVEVAIYPEPGGAPYLLQISHPSIFAFYERRFLLEKDRWGDAFGTFCKGLGRLTAAGAERPLRLLSGYDQLLRRYLEQLDIVVHAAVEGKSLDVEQALMPLLEPLRAAWAMIPWPLREPMNAISSIGHDRVTTHDPILHRTVLFATNIVEGKIVYQYIHKHHPLEDYWQVLNWMTEIYRAMITTYPPPRYAAAIARSSSIEKFIDCFPGYQRMVGSSLLEGKEENIHD